MRLSVPDVSVIVCTHNRPHLLPRALASIVAQERPGATYEVIVVDDGSEPSVTMRDNNPIPTRLLRIDHGGVGAARAAGLNAALGALIAYCDDDDEWTPDHLRVLLDALRAEPDVAMVYGDAAWSPPGERPSKPRRKDVGLRSVSASDVAHRAAAARDAGGFDPSLRAHEDWDLWQRMQQCHRLRHVPMVVTAHHATPGRIGERQHPAERRLVAGEVGMFRNLSERNARFRREVGGTVPFDPATWTAERRQLLWQSPLATRSSFDHVARRLIPAVERQGVEIAVGPLRVRPPAGFERFYRTPPSPERLGFHYDYMLWPDGMGCERIVHYGMWESTLVPCDQIAMINRAVSLFYVPCRQNVESYRARGVRVPIKVLHHGADPAEFPVLERPAREHFTFGGFGNLGSPRKGSDILVRAFRAEFDPREPVRLLIHCSYEDWVPDWLLQAVAEDPRIELIRGTVDHATVLDLLGRMDAFVLSSRGEGFGLTALEAMATGLPVIATNWSGPAEYLDPVDSFPLDYRLVDAGGTRVMTTRYFGEWAEPEVEHLRSLLRWIFEHPAEARAMGRRAAARVHSDWTWDRPAAQIVADLDLLAQGISPA